MRTYTYDPAGFLDEMWSKYDLTKNSVALMHGQHTVYSPNTNHICAMYQMALEANP